MAYKIQDEDLLKRIAELERALATALQVQKAILNSLPHIAWLKDKEGKFIHVNHHYLEAVNLSLNQIIGRTDLDIFPYEIAKRYMDDDERVMLGAHEIHFQNQRGDQWFSTIKAPVFNAEGLVIGTTGVERNITDKIITQSNLERERDFLRALMESIPDTIYYKDLECKFTRINYAKAKEVGLKDPSEAIGKTDFDFVANYEEAKIKYEDEKRILSTGEPLVNKLEKITNIQAPTYWISTTKSAIKDKDNNILGIVGISRNVTDQALMLEELHRERNFLQALMDYIPHTIYFKDKQCRFTKINKAQARMIGVDKPEDAIGKSDTDFFPHEHSDGMMSDEIVILETGIPVINKIEKLKNAKGDLLWVSATKFPLIDGDDNIYGIVGMSVDITEKFLYEQKLKEAKERAEESDRLKTAFLANMSHEIRTPMNGIIGFSNLLREPGITDEERNEFLNHINNCGNTLLTLIDDIIDISKIEAGQVKVRISDTHLNSILDELLETYLNARSLDNKMHIEIIKEAGLDDMASQIYTDPYRLRQVLSNLLTNALKFTCEGSIIFGYQLKDGYIEFYVKDTGIGIPEDKLEFIFERFGQIPDERILNRRGTGLGLAISSNLVKILGGKMWVSSVERKGSAFYFTLPYKSVELPTAISEGVRYAGEKLDLKEKTILIAEDEDTNFFYFKELLKETQAKLLWVKSGSDAVHSVHVNKNISLVLMDCQLLEMDGMEATKEIKKINPKLPVIMQTAYAFADERDRCKDAGCDGYISKPVLREELFALLFKFLFS